MELDTNNPTAGKMIRDIRKELGENQTVFGARFNLDNTTVSKIEIGKRNVPWRADFWNTLANLDGVTPEVAEAIARAAGLNKSIVPLSVDPSELRGIEIGPIGGLTVNIALHCQPGVLTQEQFTDLRDIMELSLTSVIASQITTLKLIKTRFGQEEPKQ